MYTLFFCHNAPLFKAYIQKNIIIAEKFLKPTLHAQAPSDPVAAAPYNLHNACAKTHHNLQDTSRTIHPQLIALLFQTTASENAKEYSKSIH